MLDSGDTLILKFNDVDVDFGDVLEFAPEPPLFGTTSKNDSTETRFFCSIRDPIATHDRVGAALDEM